MVGMKVGHGVISLVPIHVDHDSVERADTRHGMTIARLRVPGGLPALAVRDVPPTVPADRIIRRPQPAVLYGHLDFVHGMEAFIASTGGAPLPSCGQP